MKKIVSILLVMGLLLGTVGALAEAQNPDVRYRDENNDGVCDVCGGTDADGDGVCDSCPAGGTRPQNGAGRQYGKGRGNEGVRFADANGDGVCDNCPANGAGLQNGTGRRYGW